MEVNSSGKLIQEDTIKRAILERINLHEEMRVFFYKNPINSDAIRMMSQALDKLGAKALLERYIYYSFENGSGLSLQKEEIELLLDNSRRELLTYLRTL